MVSVIAWLDASAEDQQRAREIVQLFSDKDTIDELGARRIVVALSDALFPGTSVMNSRARYLLFTPWFCKVAATKRDPVWELERLERRMIACFLAEKELAEKDHLTGLIGRAAGPKVKQLPSTAYWSALEAWGILTWPGSQEQTLERSAQLRRLSPGDDVDELANREVGVWHPGVGQMPEGFPDETLDGGFALKAAEAEWLRERWLSTASGTLLGHLAHECKSPAEVWPWFDPSCTSAPREILDVLDEAHRFALASDGARLLYQLMVAEAYEEAGFSGVNPGIDDRREELEDWATEVQDAAPLFDGWSTASLWELVTRKNPRIDPFARQFFTAWLNLVGSGQVSKVADDPALRHGVAERERALKRGQARLVNRKLLAGWQGGFAGRTAFRWPQVSQLVSDMVDGMTA